MQKSKKKNGKATDESKQEVEVESSAKMVVIPETAPIKRPRAPGDYVLSVPEKFVSGTSPKILLKVLLTGDAIICLPRSTDSQIALVIDRFSGSMSTIACAELKFSGPKVEIAAYAILGFITVLSERFLVLATECTCVAGVGSAQVYAISRADLISISIQPAATDKSQVADVANLVLGIERFLSTQGFFFAIGCDLSRPFGNMDTTTNSGSTSFLDSGDDRYFWNREMCLEFSLLGDEGRKWIVPMIHGAVHSEELCFADAVLSEQESSTITATLISRRSRLRAWPRDAKGLDIDGNSGGFIETEQVLECGGVLSSYLIARGSCPLIWVQKSPGSSSPLIDEEGSTMALRKHIEGLLAGDGQRFKSVALLNVVGSAKDDSTVGAVQSIIRKAGLSASTSSQTLRLEPSMPGKSRALEDLLPALPFDTVLRNAAPRSTVWVSPARAAQPRTARVDAAVAAGGQDVLFRIDAADSVDRPAAAQSLIAYAALVGFVDVLTGAQTPPGQPARGIAADQLFRWKGLWLATAENLARQVRTRPPDCARAAMKRCSDGRRGALLGMAAHAARWYVHRTYCGPRKRLCRDRRPGSKPGRQPVAGRRPLAQAAPCARPGG
jgi:hypothetical protein